MRYCNYCILFLLILIGCKEPEPRKPVQVKSKSFFKESIDRSKKLLRQESDLIKSLIKKDSINTYFDSSYGFSYYYEVESKNNTYRPKTDDEVIFNYTIMTLSNDTIYTIDEIGLQRHFIDKSQLFPGLRNGLKVMRELDKITFLFPSSQGYGYKGDNDKIGPSTPLKTSVQLIKIIQNKDSLNLK